jgi:transcriptional coactivator p15 (PC4)
MSEPTQPAETQPTLKSTPVGEIKLTDSTIVKISTFDGRDGRKRVDIRLFLTGERYTGPTKKGVSVPLENLPELLKILQSVQ